MNLIKPKRLEKGDTIAIISPSGFVEPGTIEKSKRYFESRGYKIKLGANMNKKYRYMAGTDEERLSDLHEAFADKDVDAILCARGGYGAIRLLDKINYNLIKRNPKIFCGYSDISALSAMILKKTGLITFSGPMAISDFQIGDINRFTEENFWETLTSHSVSICPQEIKIYNLTDKKMEGILFGGNLSTITSLCGTDFIPDEKFLFFAEDLNEQVYKIDKYFTQLFNINKFRNNISAIAAGDFLTVESEKLLEEVLIDIGRKYDISVIGNYPFSHGCEKATVPYGGKAYIKDGIIKVEY